MSLERVLEPEVMDSVEDARDYDAMDHSTVNDLFVGDFLATGFTNGDILDLGTGTAMIPILLSKRLTGVRIMAVDMSVNMLEIARSNLEVYQATRRVQLAQIDAKEMVFEDEMFDAVISNSIIHHIPEPAVVIRESIRCTKRGGKLFFRDLLRPDSIDTLRGLVQQYASGESDHARKMFADSLHAALSLGEIRELVAAEGFDPESVIASSDRHWTWSATRPGTGNR